jgi:hypothetical protein
MKQHLIDTLVEKAKTVPLPSDLTIRNIEAPQGDWGFQILINCYSPGCEQSQGRGLSVFSDVFRAINDHFIDPEYVKACGFVCQDAEVLPDYGQSQGPVYRGTRFWFQFMPIRDK